MSGVCLFAFQSLFVSRSLRVCVCVRTRMTRCCFKKVVAFRRKPKEKEVAEEEWAKRLRCGGSRKPLLLLASPLERAKERSRRNRQTRKRRKRHM